MEPFITLLVVVTVTRLVRLRNHRPGWHTPFRVGLAAMFFLTSAAHFVGLRDELIAMVPPGLPDPGLLVTISGVLEALGAVGLLLRRTAPAAAGGLTLMLLAMFPANVHHALSVDGLPFYDQLVPRALMQVVFVAATVAVVLTRPRNDRPRDDRPRSDRGQASAEARSAVRRMPSTKVS
jgi:uncharacterized membrane protein